ncbi:hypothetical protein Tco_1100801, partial [Tanacetum coccineum]
GIVNCKLNKSTGSRDAKLQKWCHVSKMEFGTRNAMIRCIGTSIFKPSNNVPIFCCKMVVTLYRSISKAIVLEAMYLQLKEDRTPSSDFTLFSSPLPDSDSIPVNLTNLD